MRVSAPFRHLCKLSCLQELASLAMRRCHARLLGTCTDEGVLALAGLELQPATTAVCRNQSGVHQHYSGVPAGARAR